MAERTELDHVDIIMMQTKDPTTLIEGLSVPALTTLLYRVCDNDERRFEEADRLVRLFIETAIADTKRRYSLDWQDMADQPAAVTLVFKAAVDQDGMEKVWLGLARHDDRDAVAWSYLPGVTRDG